MHHWKCGLIAALALTGCAQTVPPSLLPTIDLSPVECGYKWFQSGYSPEVAMACHEDRSAIHASQTALAIDHAWEIATTRCPIACPPRALQDTVEREAFAPEGVCRQGRVYYTSRVFFQCSGP